MIIIELEKNQFGGWAADNLRQLINVTTIGIIKK